ncbi:MAG TPA: hypothetical protein VFW73_01895 [Lacipirellulaceae bacterium]|nr:hypothetical protein [Lacipirellulaceae bacterium]
MAKTEKLPASKTGRSRDKVPRHRSPNYPSLDLRSAVDKLPGLFEAMKRHPVGVEVAVKAMGYSYNSSTGKLALAAMRAFGLFENVQSGSNATVKLSTRALDIAADYPRESDHWWAAVKKAALIPNVHSQLWEQYGASLPADDEVRRFLVRQLKFGDKAVDAFIEEYKATIDFAKLSDSDIIEKSNGNEDDPMVDRKTPFHDVTTAPPKSGVKQDRMMIGDCQVIVQRPDRLTEDVYNDLKSMFSLVLRNAKRTIAGTDD